jgi:hypothetical protein
MNPYEKFATDRVALARSNPKLCYMLEVVKPRLIPRVYRIEAHFDTVTTGQRLEAVHLRKPMCQDAIIWDLEYTIRCPGYLGSPFYPKYQYDLRIAPFVDVDIEILGCEGGCGGTDNLHITDFPIPLETAMHAAQGPSNHLSVLGDWRTIEKDFDLSLIYILQRTLNADEVPYQIIVIAKMWELDKCCKMCDLEDKVVRAGLCDCGLLSDITKGG